MSSTSVTNNWSTYCKKSTGWTVLDPAIMQYTNKTLLSIIATCSTSQHEPIYFEVILKSNTLPCGTKRWHTASIGSMGSAIIPVMAVQPQNTASTRSLGNLQNYLLPGTGSISTTVCTIIVSALYKQTKQSIFLHEQQLTSEKKTRRRVLKYVGAWWAYFPSSARGWKKKNSGKRENVTPNFKFR